MKQHGADLTRWGGGEGWPLALVWSNGEALCHTPILEDGIEASICVPRKFKSHV
jgi:hypothetical protein